MQLCFKVGLSGAVNSTFTPTENNMIRVKPSGYLADGYLNLSVFSQMPNLKDNSHYKGGLMSLVHGESLPSTSWKMKTKIYAFIFHLQLQFK